MGARDQFVLTLPALYPKQRAAIYQEKRIVVIEASTKAGKTLGCIVWLLEGAWGDRPGDISRWVAPIRSQAKIAFKRIKAGLPHWAYKANEQEMTLTLPSGAVIEFKSADDPDSLFGEDAKRCVFDEATRAKEEAFDAIRSTLTATRGPLRIIGNVKGRKNWVYRLARRGEAGDPDVGYARLTAYDAAEGGVFPVEEIESAKRVLRPSVFAELYMAQAQDDASNPFGYAEIQACLIPRLSTLPPVVWGWDLARKRNWTVGIALDRNGHMCRMERFTGGTWTAQRKRILEATGHTPALVDQTGIGDAVLEELQKGRGNFEGYLYTPRTKQILMEELEAAIGDRSIGVVGTPDGSPGQKSVVQVELESFEYEFTRTGVVYSAPEGQEDDCVNSLALAQHRRAHVRIPSFATAGSRTFARDRVAGVTPR